MLRRAIPVLHVTRSERALDFYRGGLGFHLEFAAPGGSPLRDPCYLGVKRDGAVLHLSSHAGDGVAGGVAYVLLDDVDALHEELRGRGIPIHVGPVDQTWGMRELYIRDPDGNTIRFGTVA